MQPGTGTGWKTLALVNHALCILACTSDLHTPEQEFVGCLEALITFKYGSAPTQEHIPLQKHAYMNA